jgi:radical SAM family uncharacterized protein
MSQQKRIEEELLPFIQSPSQYIGREMNMVVKDWNSISVHVAMGFPDTYAIGTGSLAMQIVYHLLNSRPDTLCERVFCPWTDAGDRMRVTSIPLFSLESYTAIRDFDIFALTVPYEMLYSNILEMLDLAGISVFSRDRKETDPLVIAGGSQMDNPEPLADFLDVAIIGDAEATLPAFIDAYKEYKSQSLKRDEILQALAKRFPWVYVPKFYNIVYNDDGTIRSVTPTVPGIACPVKREIVMDLDAAPYPTSPTVPIHDVVHDRINIEIMRGCPNVCRFCHEGYTRKPVRKRSIEKIFELAKETYANTGITEISLCSLSSADYPNLEELFNKLNDYFAPQHVSIALPSLRVEKQLQMIPSQTSMVRKAPLTIALEAGSERLRKMIHKNIDLENLKPAVLEAYRCGWRGVKLYFMVGFPGETQDDLLDLIDLADEIGQWRKAVSGRAADVNVSISFLVPKSQTPMQWLGQKSLEYFEESINVLRQAVRPFRHIKLSYHDRFRSRLEAIFARGNRTLSAALFQAWKNGARFDSWDDTFQYQRWLDAFEATKTDTDFFANRNFASTEILPWEHIDIGLKKTMLISHLTEMVELNPDLKASYPI